MRTAHANNCSNTVRLHAVAVLAVALALGWPVRTHAADVNFLPNPGFVCDTLVVNATIDASVTDLRGFSFILTFNPAAVQPIAVTAGSLITGAACPNVLQWVNAAAIGDSIYVDCATLGCSVAGPGNILSLKFVRVAHGATSPIQCRYGVLRDALNQSIPYTCHPGLLQTCPAIGVEQRVWTRVKRLYR